MDKLDSTRKMLMEKYDSVGFSESAILSLARFDNAIYKYDQEDNYENDRYLFTSVYLFKLSERIERAESELDEYTKRVPEGSRVPVVPIGELSLYDPIKINSPVYRSMGLSTMDSRPLSDYSLETDILLGSDGSVWVHDYHHKNLCKASETLAEFICLLPSDHFYERYIAKFPAGF